MNITLRLIALIASLACVSALRAYTNDLITSFGVSSSWITVSIETDAYMDTTFEVFDKTTNQVVATITAMTSGWYSLQYFSEDYASGFSGSYYYPGYDGNFTWEVYGVCPEHDYALRLYYPDSFDGGFYGSRSANIHGYVNPH